MAVFRVRPWFGSVTSFPATFHGDNFLNALGPSVCTPSAANATGEYNVRFETCVLRGTSVSLFRAQYGPLHVRDANASGTTGCGPRWWGEEKKEKNRRPVVAEVLDLGFARPSVRHAVDARARLERRRRRLKSSRTLVIFFHLLVRWLRADFSKCYVAA